MSAGSTKSRSVFRFRKGVMLSAALLLCSSVGWSQRSPFVEAAKSLVADPQAASPPKSGPQQIGQQAGSIRGKVVDQSGANIAGADVKLAREGRSPPLEVKSDQDGQFAFSNVAPGPFQLTISSPRLTTQEFSGFLHSGQDYVTPLIMLAIPNQVTVVHVGVPPQELAGLQVQQQVKQRIFGFVPNFYVSYFRHAAPLGPKQKFELAWRSATDPMTFVGVGLLAGIGQATDRWGAYGQGAQGYAKRYGASYADVFGATFIGGAVLPSILKQDPRYFYKGTGSKRSRFLYAIASSVICKGDNGRWQPNYSNVLGSFAAGGLEKLYLPADDRQGSSFIVSAALIRLGETSVAGILQEFAFPRITRNRPATPNSN